MRRRLAVLGMLIVAGCASADPPRAAEPTPRAIVNAEHGFTVRLPPGWTASSESLTPGLTNPVEILSAATFGDMRANEGDCGHIPVGAVAQMGHDDAFVSIQERFGETTFPTRPARFALPAPDDRGDAAVCAGRGGDLDTYWFDFSDAGRGFHVLAVIGRTASPARRAEVLALLDSLRFEPGPQGVHLDGDLAVHQADRELGLSWVTVSPWRRYVWRLTSTNGERLALGTFDLERGPPDANCTPGAAIDAMPPDGAFIYLFEYVDGHAGFADRDGELELGPTQQFECLGESRMTRWRDHGRDFQAHVYFGERASDQTQRNARSILNSIQATSAKEP